MAKIKKSTKTTKSRKKAASTTGAGKSELERCKKRLERMSIEHRIYRELGGLASEGAPIKSILNRLMDITLKALDTNAGTLYCMSPGQDELSFEIVKGPLAKKLQGLKISSDKGIAGLVARTGKPYICEHLAEESHWAGIRGSEKDRNMMAVPLKVKDTVIGVIQVINKSGAGVFTKGDLNVLTSLANHYSIIMERANLFKELDDRLRQFSTLNKVSALLISSLDHRVVRRRALEAITKLMDAETGSLLMVEEGTGSLSFEVALGESGEALKKAHIKIGQGIAGWVAKTGKPLLVPDASKDKRFLSTMDKKSKFITRNLMCVPIKIKGKVIGVLEAINRVDGTFTKDDLALFALFSNQVAIALDNARLYSEIRETFYATSEALAEAIEKRDPYTGGHTKRVLEYSLATARHLNMSEEDFEIVKLSAVLHDIGKIGVEDSILRKEAPLDDREAAAMKKHPLYGGEILKRVPQLKAMVPGMMYHHERPDGRGYPKALKGKQIPMVARIISVADTYDAMTTDRPYRKGLTSKIAIAELKKYAGTQFDRTVVKAFLEAFKNGEIEGIAHCADPLHVGRKD